MWDFVTALGLVFVIEGLLFAAFPDFTRAALRAASESPSDRMRIVGILSAVAGVALIWLARKGFGL